MSIKLVNVIKIRLITRLVPMVLLGAAASTGCQPTQHEDTAPSTPIEIEVPKTLTPSDAALNAIETFQTDYVDRMLTLQQNQLAEYQALQATATPPSPPATQKQQSDVSPDTVVTVDDDDSRLAKDTNTQKLVATHKDSEAGSNNTTESNVSENSNNMVTNNTTTNKTVVNKKTDSTEVTLTELPLATTPLVQPEVLTVPELKSRYQQAMQSLYLVDDEPIPSQDMDTLLSIATVIPDVFKTDDLARRLVLKTPALARLLKQYQIWEQMEKQQSAELEALKQARILEQEKQAKDFAALMSEFDGIIQGYDEQIAKYEKTLTEFE